jgi:hypothetical protein
MLAHRSAPALNGRGHRVERPADPRSASGLRARAWLAHGFALVTARPRRFAAFVAVTFALVLVVAAIVGAVDPRYERAPNDWGSELVGVWGLVTFLLWIPVGIGTLNQWLKKRRTRRSTAKIDETIRDYARSRSESNVQTISAVVASASTRLVEQRLRRASVRQLVSEGSGELSSYYPDLPRSVKRVANRHYLLASVAVSRHMIGGTPPLTAQHLSKWALMMERWPELAEEIVDRPSLVGELEQRARADGDAASGHCLSELLPEGISEHEELVRLLRDPTSIATIAERLVFALPDRS